MYNGFYSYFEENNYYLKKIGFTYGHSTKHALLELIDQINESFNNNNYFLGIFIDLSKAFEIVDHQILFKKLHFYGIRYKTLKWFSSYLSNKKQCIRY